MEKDKILLLLEELQRLLTKNKSEEKESDINDIFEDKEQMAELVKASEDEARELVSVDPIPADIALENPYLDEESDNKDSENDEK